MDGMGREMGGRFKREGICEYLWLVHVEVWQKTKFYKAIIHQLKINKFQKKTSSVTIVGHFLNRDISLFHKQFGNCCSN